MKLDENISCPRDGVQINETKVRVVAGLVLLVGVVYLGSGWLSLPLLLTLDFGLRSADLARFSPLGNLAEWLVKAVRLPYKGTDQAPKRFAARVGLGFSLFIVILQLGQLPTLIPMSVLLVFAALESLVGFCAGCYVFTYYTRWFPKSI